MSTFAASTRPNNTSTASPEQGRACVKVEREKREKSRKRRRRRRRRRRREKEKRMMVLYLSGAVDTRQTTTPTCTPTPIPHTTPHHTRSMLHDSAVCGLCTVCAAAFTESTKHRDQVKSYCTPESRETPDLRSDPRGLSPAPARCLLLCFCRGFLRFVFAPPFYARRAARGALF